MGRRWLAMLVGLWLVAGSLPVPAQVRLICRATGQPMRPVPGAERPTLCRCRRVAPAQARSAAPSLAPSGCCTIEHRPERSQAPALLLAPESPIAPTVPVLGWALPAVRPAPLSFPAVATPSPRGPPGSAGPPRAPPALS